MRALAIAVLLMTLMTAPSSCGGGVRPGSLPTSTGPSSSANISISPGSAIVGSPDLTLTILGSSYFTFYGGHWHSTVHWSQAGMDTPLLTTFVSSSQLTAVVPATFLASAGTAKVHVETWDMIENTLLALSIDVPFEVTSTPATMAIPSISSISPSAVAAGSGDVTITIDGSNFGQFGHFVWSTAFWTTDANLHDHGTMLQTTIVSSSQLTAVIPASLLQSPTSVQILVMNGDVMGMSDGYFGYPRSNSVTFTVGP